MCATPERQAQRGRRQGTGGELQLARKSALP
jgi:hypothetical protein